MRFQFYGFYSLDSNEDEAECEQGFGNPECLNPIDYCFSFRSFQKSGV